MILKRLEIAGFKSFADPTDFEFRPGVTAFVGPNGCGKSNVVDAVRWILGEQRVRSLRGHEMTDVIYAGAGGQGAVDFAEGSLLLDNSRRMFPVDFDEVQITRRCWRTGDNEYFINRQACRLRDVRELLLGTGIGNQGYFVLEQGKIDHVISSSAEERRTLFDEAAGISRFNVKRREAARKLEQVVVNLERLAAVRVELERQERTLRLQAARAERFREYTTRLTDLRTRSERERFRRLGRELEEVRGRRGGLEERLREALASREEAASARASLAAARERARELETEARERLAGQDARRDRVTDQARSLDGAAEAAAAEGRRLREEAGRLAESLVAREEEIRTLVEGRDQVDQALRFFEGLLHDKGEEQGDREHALLVCRRQEETAHGAILEAEGRLTAVRNDLAAGRAEVAAMEAGIGRLERREREVREGLAALEARREGARRSEEERRRSAADLETRRDSLEREAREAAGRCDAQRAVRETEREREQGLAARLQVLEELIRTHEGVGEGVRLLLGEGERVGVRGILGDHLVVERRYVAAIERALAGAEQFVWVRDRACAMSALDLLRERAGGEATVFHVPPGEPEWTRVLPDEGLLGPALRHVDGPAELRPILAALLRHVLLAEGRESALRFLESEAHAGRRVVTLDGEEFGPGTCARGGVRGAGSRILERRVERDEVEVQLRGARETLLRAERELEAAERQARELADGVEALRRSAEEAHGETRTATFQREELDRSVAREEEELRLGSDERRALEEAWRAQRERLEARGRDEAELERKVQEARDQAARAGARRDALDRTLRELEEERGRASAGRSAGQARREGLKRSLEAAERALREGREGLTLLRMELEALAERERKLQTEAEEARQEAGRLEAARPEAAALVQERHAEGEELETGVASWEGLVQKLEEGALGAREELEGLRVREGQLDVRREELVTRLREETGLDLLTAPPAEAATIDPEAMDAEIADLRRKLEPYKNVNLEAIDQLKEVEERLRFLVEQEGDLTRSRDTLEDVIRDIQTRCRDLFDQTFTEVRENFRVLFRKFFGGGNADLVLLQPEEPLESGIEIVAQPPGKGAKSIDLLSGGEKTMTAIAVLFALFQAKPSPFCILDEVDAALDESNIGRFLLVLQAFLDRSQFLIITHNKKTMAIADVLYGITMETQGRSKRVAVEFRERAAPVGAVPVSAGDGNGNGSGNGHGDVVAP